MTQTARLVEYLRTHPQATGLEIVRALSLPKYTSRISDARAAGIDIVCERRSDGRLGYRVVESRPAPLSGTQEAMAL